MNGLSAKKSLRNIDRQERNTHNGTNIHSGEGDNMTNSRKSKRATILEATLKVFAEDGFDSIPTSRIAKQANVGIGTLYRQFGSKDALIEALHQEIDQKLDPLADSAIDEQAPVKENLVETLKRIFLYLVENPQEFRFLERYCNSTDRLTPKRSSGDGCLKSLYRLMQQGIDQKLVKDLPLDILFALCFGPVIMLARAQLSGLFNATEEMLETSLSACWDAIRQ